jgi:arylsulfatase A-like enzyme/Flp pilus assembly protein TadD
MKPYLNQVKLFLALAVISLTFFCLNEFLYSSPTKKLNLLLITVDTLRADHIGIYGDKVRTPAMDELGNSGVVFTRTYSHVPLTLPSHCSLLTGTIPPVHGVRDNGYRFSGRDKTLAEILKDKGYITAAFVGAFPLDSRFGLDKGFDLYDDNYGSRNLQRDLTFVERKAEEVTKKASVWLEDNKEKKFFLWVHYFDPHAPYEPPSPFDEEYRGREYEGEVAYTDKMIGQLLAKLNSLGLTDDTVIVLTSDHGEGLGEHQEKTHGIFVYDSTLHVPLIFFNRKILPQGRVVSELTGLTDILPTVLDLLNIPFNINEIQGRSLKATMLRRKSLGDREIYIESVAAMLDRNWAPLQGLISKNWKYIEAPRPELYDLNKDPQELNNLLEEHPQVTRQLQKKLREMMARNAFPSLTEIQRPAMNRDTYEKLRSLGYISGKTLKAGENRPDPKTMIEIDNLFSDAIILSEAGRLEEARLVYETLLEKQPNFAVGYEYAAYNLYKMERLEEAVSLLRKALQMDLATVSIKARLGLYLQESGEIQESINLLQAALQQDPYYTEAYNYLGVSYFKTGELSQAEDAFKKALELDSDYAMAINNLGNAYLAQGKYEQAAATYSKAISTDPGLASAYNGLGVAFYREGNINGALSIWKKALGIDPNQADAAYNLGRTFLKSGDKEEALKYLEIFLKIAPVQKYSEDIKQVKAVVERLKEEIRQFSSPDENQFII